jgi:hypothetical protein
MLAVSLWNYVWQELGLRIGAVEVLPALRLYLLGFFSRDSQLLARINSMPVSLSHFESAGRPELHAFTALDSNDEWNLCRARAKPPALHLAHFQSFGKLPPSACRPNLGDCLVPGHRRAARQNALPRFEHRQKRRGAPISKK